MEQDDSENQDVAASGLGQEQCGEVSSFAGRIREGMEVVSDEGSHIGTVAGIEGDEILLGPEGSAGGAREYVPLSLVAAVDGACVIMAARGDNAFGEEASH
jgi:hypothetical protein